MINAVKDAGMVPVTDIRNCWKDGEETKQYKNTNIVYNYKEEVFYVDDKGENIKMSTLGN